MKKIRTLKRIIAGLLMVIFLFEQTPVLNVLADDDTYHSEENESENYVEDTDGDPKDPEEENLSEEETSTEVKVSNENNDNGHDDTEESSSVNENTAEKSDDNNNTDTEETSSDTDENSMMEESSSDAEADYSVEENEDTEESEKSVSENTLSENIAEQESEIEEEVIEEETENEVYETEVSDDWYEDYEYQLGIAVDGIYESTIGLNYYKGNDTELYVPNIAMVEGERCRVVITSACFSGEKHENCKSIEKIYFENDVIFLGCLDEFRMCSSLENVDMSGVDTSRVSDMTGMFDYCYNLKDVDLSGIDTENVKGMSQMFQYCTSLESLNLDSFDTQNVTDMTGMFGNCYMLENLSISSFDTSCVESINLMFTSCKSLKRIDMSSFDLSALKETVFLPLNATSPDIIHSPKNLSYEIKLSNTYVDVNGNEYTTLPLNKTNSIYLMKKGSEAVDDYAYYKGDGTESSPYIIGDYDDLCYFEQSVNAGRNYYGKFVVLGADIYVNDTQDFDEWSDDYAPANVWDGINGFTGTFDGNGYFIYGVYMKGNADSTGFFNYFPNQANSLDESNKLKATIKNLNIVKCYISGKSNVGGIAGSAGYVYIYNCSVDGKIKGTGNSIGGFVGNCGSPGHRGTRIYSSVNKSAVEGNDKVGGFIGYGYIGNEYVMHMGRPDSWEYNGCSEMIVLDSCVNEGSITATGDNIGGIIGYVDQFPNCGGVLITKNVNYGAVKGEDNVGGISGFMYSDVLHNSSQKNIKLLNVSMCCNYGNIMGTSSVGGLFGYNTADYGNTISIDDVYNAGTVFGSNSAGGIMGTLQKGVTISRYFNYCGVNVNGGTGSALVATGNLSSGYDSYSYHAYFLDGSGTSGIVTDGIVLSIVEMKEVSSYSEFDFDSTWKMGSKHPIFQWQDDESDEYSENDENEIFDGFSIYTYQADYLIDNQREFYIDITNQTTPCEEISNKMDEAQGTIIELWRCGAGFECISDPTLLGEGYKLTQEDIYFGILMDIVKTTEKDSILDSYLEVQDTVYEAEKKYKTLYTDIKLTDTYESLSPKKKEDFNQVLVECFCKDDKNPDAHDKYLSEVNSILEVASTVGDAYSMVQNAMILRNLNEDSKRAMLEFKSYVTEHDNNEYLIGAIDRALGYMNDDFRWTCIKISGRYGAEYAYDQAWGYVFDAIMKENPTVAAFMLSYKTTRWIVNATLNTDKVCGCEVECLFMYEITEAFDGACIHQMSVYSQNRNDENARTLLATTKMMLRARLVNCDKAIALCRSLDNDASSEPWYNLGTIDILRTQLLKAFPNLTHEDMIKNYTVYKDSYNESFQSLLVAWIDDLQETYPDCGLYEYYKDKKDDADSRIKNHIYTFACPITVSVESDLGISFINDEKLHAEDDIVVALAGEQKIVYTVTENDYDIVIEGIDDGLMKSSICSYDEYENSFSVRSYYDIPVYNGILYEVKATLDDSKADTNRIMYSNGSEVETYNSELGIKHKVSIEQGYFIVDGEMCWDDVELAEHEEIVIVAYVPVGTRFAGWEGVGDVELSDRNAISTTLRVENVDILIRALYEEIVPTYTVTATSGEGGTIALNGDVLLCAGGSQEFAMLPDKGFQVEDVIVDGISLGAIENYCFENVNEDHKIEVLFSTVDYVLGDTNADLKVNAADRIYLARYLAGWSEYELINEMAADVNKDNKINAADRIYLARYMAGWNGYELE